jgi:hypothetical protein
MKGRGRDGCGEGSPETEFFDVIGTKVLLALHNHLY